MNFRQGVPEIESSQEWDEQTTQKHNVSGYDAGSEAEKKKFYTKILLLFYFNKYKKSI